MKEKWSRCGRAVRAVTYEDAVAVARLVAALYAELNEGTAVPDYRLDAVQEVLREMDRSFGYLAFDGDSIIGLLMLTEGVAIFAGGTFGQITELYVAPEYRSRGVASQLLQHCAEFGRARGWKRIDVGAPHQPRWSRSLDFYKSEGFVEVGPRLKLEL